MTASWGVLKKADGWDIMYLLVNKDFWVKQAFVQAYVYLYIVGKLVWNFHDVRFLIFSVYCNGDPT